MTVENKRESKECGDEHQATIVSVTVIEEEGNLSSKR
jgi:hypothetical protein